MTTRDDDAPLELPLTITGYRPKGLGPGAVYQGVSKQIRALIKDGTIDRSKDAGTIAAARSCARAIDHASGHNDRGRVASGMQLAQLHAALLAWLNKLDDSGASLDPFSAWLEELRNENPEEVHPGGSAEASHPAF